MKTATALHQLDAVRIGNVQDAQNIAKEIADFDKDCSHFVKLSFALFVALIGYGRYTKNNLTFCDLYDFLDDPEILEKMAATNYEEWITVTAKDMVYFNRDMPNHRSAMIATAKVLLKEYIDKLAAGC